MTGSKFPGEGFFGDLAVTLTVRKVVEGAISMLSIKNNVVGSAAIYIESTG